MNFWVSLTVNSITFGGLLFLLSSGFALIFGLMRIPNLTHGSLYMLGAYVGATFLIGFISIKVNFWVAAILATLIVAAAGALIERLLLRQLPGDQLAQVLVTLGISFMAADLCLMLWGGDPINVAPPAGFEGFIRYGTIAFPIYRLAIIVIAVVVAIGLWLLLDRPRLGAMIRAGVDDPDMARVVGIRVSRLFTVVFCLGAALAGFAGVIGAPILAVAVLIAAPYWLPGTYYVNIATQILIYAIFALGMDVLLGYGGLVSLGHARVFGRARYGVPGVLGGAP